MDLRTVAACVMCQQVLYRQTDGAADWMCRAVALRTQHAQCTGWSAGQSARSARSLCAVALSARWQQGAVFMRCAQAARSTCLHCLRFARSVYDRLLASGLVHSTICIPFPQPLRAPCDNRSVSCWVVMHRDLPTEEGTFLDFLCSAILQEGALPGSGETPTRILQRCPAGGPSAAESQGRV
ncbi:hypothetical protein NDU88_002179 [Pleurodeles waltl]|uniref:Uncharacterized protein n=1 Tax=Pleurodeles waltl TaxID=8319 RepID=A0AAV7NEQ2_PLEWA|nr:hypothetical protein NDU88_002179 [Pleurodeles waltl]